jgi:CheY-like chemotaxis protein
MDLAADLRLIRGDASALTHALMNLYVNAVDAMPGAGTLTLRTRNAGDDWIEVLVEDTGTGMSREVLERAMDPLFTTKEVGKGTGLGLSMVYNTVKAHLGQIEVQSQPGQGTCVTMRLPACEAPGQASGPLPSTPKPRVGLQPESSRRTQTVLTVDDDELIQCTMQVLLETMGHAAVAAFTGEEALEKLGAGLQADVVILDMNMPGLGGGETLPRLRALWPSLPVLLATGRVDQFALDLAQAHPHVALLSKPFSKMELQQHLDGLGLG